MATNITKTKMLELYEKGIIELPIYTGNRIYARIPATEDEPAKVVYCTA